MKKILYLSGIAAALVLVGCGGGDSGSGSSAPSFASTEATIESPEDASKAIVATNTHIIPSNITVQNIKTTIQNAKVNDILNNKIKIASLIDKKNNLKFKALNTNTFNSMSSESQEALNEILATSGDVCPVGSTEVDVSYHCNKSGSAKEVYTITRDGNLCSYSIKIIASNCAFEEENEEEIYSGILNGTLENKVTAYVPNDAESIDDIKTTELLRSANYTLKYNREDKNSGDKYDGSELAQLSDQYSLDYSEVSGDIVYTNKITEKIKGKYAETENKNGKLDFDFKFNSNFSVGLELVKDNTLSILIDGWVEESLNIPEINDDFYFGIGADNFNAVHQINKDILTSKFSGKLGTTCTNGLINFDTKLDVEDKINDIYVPYKGHLVLTGANGTEADIRFMLDENNTPYAKVTVNGQEKIYHSYEEMKADSNCSTGNIIVPGIDLTEE